MEEKIKAEFYEYIYRTLTRLHVFSQIDVLRATCILHAVRIKLALPIRQPFYHISSVKHRRDFSDLTAINAVYNTHTHAIKREREREKFTMSNCRRRLGFFVARP